MLATGGHERKSRAQVFGGGGPLSASLSFGSASHRVPPRSSAPPPRRRPGGARTCTCPACASARGTAGTAFACARRRVRRRAAPRDARISRATHAASNACAQRSTVTVFPRRRSKHTEHSAVSVAQRGGGGGDKRRVAPTAVGAARTEASSSAPRRRISVSVFSVLSEFSVSSHVPSPGTSRGSSLSPRAPEIVRVPNPDPPRRRRIDARIASRIAPRSSAPPPSPPQPASPGASPSPFASPSPSSSASSVSRSSSCRTGCTPPSAASRAPRRSESANARRQRVAPLFEPRQVPLVRARQARVPRLQGLYGPVSVVVSAVSNSNTIVPEERGEVPRAPSRQPPQRRTTSPNVASGASAYSLHGGGLAPREPPGRTPQTGARGASTRPAGRGACVSRTSARERAGTPGGTRRPKVNERRSRFSTSVAPGSR